jgi:prepilin-type N-terminal cleavage/methylation domain-containing protein
MVKPVRKREKGLTLVEVLAVLVIMGLILHFFSQRFESLIQTVEKDVIEADFRVAKSSVTQYYLDNRDVPFEENDMKKSLGFDVVELEEKDGVKKYKTKNKRDTWNRNYLIYSFSGDGTNSPYFAMLSLGPDGKKSMSIDSPEDDIIYIFYPTK